MLHTGKKERFEKRKKKKVTRTMTSSPYFGHEKI